MDHVMSWRTKKGTNELSHLLGCTFAGTVPRAVLFDVGDGRPLVNRVERQEVNLFDACSCLILTQM
ncbi:hypothetical protein EJ110_NYTH40906 [Nymphaea thermarum]|nr:hypothetical protein EJ110_NYTH40906 [Nymphaea thermarum]